jgi:hypothetical protein
MVLAKPTFIFQNKESRLKVHIHVYFWFENMKGVNNLEDLGIDWELMDPINRRGWVGL